MENQTTHTVPPVSNPAPASQPPQKVRRVGTFAFGLVLIAAGVLILTAIFVPGWNPLPVLRFAPVILIVLGIEVLLYASRPNVLLKYDFLSMVACAFIIVVVGGASIVPSLWAWIGPENQTRQMRVTAQLEDAVYDAITADRTLKNVVTDTRTGIYNDVFFDANINDLSDLGRYGSYVRFTLAPTYDTAEKFAAACKKIMTACADLPIAEMDFQTAQNAFQEEPYPGFSLHSRGRILQNADAATIALSVNTWWEYQGNSFDSRQRLESWMQSEQESVEPQSLEDAYEAGYEEGYFNALVENGLAPGEYAE